MGRVHNLSISVGCIRLPKVLLDITLRTLFGAALRLLALASLEEAAGEDPCDAKGWAKIWHRDGRELYDRDSVEVNKVSPRDL